MHRLTVLAAAAVAIIALTFSVFADEPEEFELDEAAIEYTCPTGWKASEDGDRFTLDGKDGKIRINEGDADETWEGETADLVEMAGITGGKVEKGKKIGGFDAVEYLNTYDNAEKGGKWTKRQILLKAKRVVDIMALGPEKHWKEINKGVDELLKSIKPKQD